MREVFNHRTVSQVPPQSNITRFLIGRTAVVYDAVTSRNSHHRLLLGTLNRQTEAGRIVSQRAGVNA